MRKASYARSGGGKVSKSALARNGMINKVIGDPLYTPEEQPEVASQGIPEAGPQGVPDAIDGPSMAEFTRDGNEELRNVVVAAARGEQAYGPSIVSSVARTGGQVRVAPSQFGVWAQQVSLPKQ